MKRLLFGLFCIVVALTGCSPALQETRTSPTHKFEKTYNIGVIQEASSGSAMLSILSEYRLPSYKIKHEYKPPELPVITPDQVWVARYTLGENFILTTKKYPYDTHLGIEVKPSGELSSEKPWIRLDKNRRPMQKIWKSPDLQVFVQCEDYVLHDRFFKAELIYNGRTANVIHLSHRQFENYRGRPSYVDQINYDLNASDLILFRSLKIKVLEADNVKIKFISSVRLTIE